MNPRCPRWYIAKAEDDAVVLHSLIYDQEKMLQLKKTWIRQ